MQILGIDPGLKNLGLVVVEWSPKVRRVLWSRTVKTTSKMPDSERWEEILSALRETIELGPPCIACEEMTGVRHGHSDRGTTNSNADCLIEVQGAIRGLARVYHRRLTLIRSLSSYAAMGVRIPKIPGETKQQRSNRQKAATFAAANLFFAGAEGLTEHEADAAIHAGGVALGKGVVA